MTRLWNLIISIVLAIGLAACTSHPRKVDCEGKLQPINPPAPVARPDGTP